VKATARGGVRSISYVGAEKVPMFDFHPQRMRMLFPTAKALANAGVNSVAGGFAETMMGTVGNLYLEAQRQLMPKTRLRRKLQAPGRAENDFMQLSMFFADFHHCGKQIFDFPTEMVEMFRRTEVDGIPLDAIKLPYNSMYMHFGRQEDLEIQGGWAPDGAYVAVVGGEENRVMQFCLTFAPKDPAAYERFLEYPEPTYVQAVGSDKLKMGVGEAVDLVASERIAKLKHEIEKGSRISPEDMQRLSEETGMTLVDATSRYAQGELDGLSAKHKAWTEMLKLVVNGMAYLSAYPEDWEDQVGGSQPLPWSITSELDSGDARRAKKARSRLAELGYTAVHFCGVRLRSMGYGANPRRTREDGGQEAADEAWTWVRGHWRRQAHGPQWSQHRLRWQMPYKRSLQGALPDGEDGRGHVYLVS